MRKCITSSAAQRVLYPQRTFHGNELAVLELLVGGHKILDIGLPMVPAKKKGMCGAVKNDSVDSGKNTSYGEIVPVHRAGGQLVHHFRDADIDLLCSLESSVLVGLETEE